MSTPIATATRAGLMSPGQVAQLQAAFAAIQQAAEAKRLACLAIALGG